MAVELSPDSEKQEIWDELQRVRRELEKARKALDDYKKRHPETVGVKHGRAYVIQSPAFPAEPSGRKPGAQPGHAGRNRPLAPIDARVRLRLKTCPDCCGNNLSRIQEKRIRTVEDITVAQATATQFTLERRYCRDCQKLVEPVVATALKGARIGLRAMLMVAWLRIANRVPEEAVAHLMRDCFGLRISTGEVQHILDQLAHAYSGFYDALLADLRKRATKNMDESTWRTNGVNQYAWAFVSQWETVFVIDPRRSHHVPLAVLGPDAEGVATIDGHSAYRTLANKTNLRLQRCWAHILGDAKELAQFYGDEGQRILDGMKPIYAKAKDYAGTATPYQLARLHDALRAVLDQPFKSHHCKTFARNHLKHADDLFRFATNPHIDGTNNRAERAIRPLVVARKISGGSRSHKGARVRALLTSVQQTLAQQGLRFLEGPGLHGRPASMG
ncbi:MAG: IS66 family transposase [Thermoplasmatota archaeon]|nr:IS66 family transposase [Halobacteriales archaeon]